MTGEQKKKKIAWNGVEFDVPDNWEPVTVKINHILFESNHQPIMEIKWFKNSKHPVKQFDQFFSDFSNLSSPPEKVDTPESWQPVLNQFEVQAFSWKYDEKEAVGLMSHCHQCQTSTFFQFFSHPDINSIPETGAEILASYCDHPAGNNWSLFDFSIQLPIQYKLKTYSFQVGRFQLDFQSPKKHSLTFHRLALAPDILKTQSLESLAKELSPIKFPEPVHESKTNDVLQWSHTTKGFFNIFAHRIRRKPTDHWGKIWHDTTHDKILAIHASGSSLDQHECINISSNFQIH